MTVKLILRRFGGVLLALGLLVSLPAASAERVALVIGINDYGTLPNLANARKDAEGMAAKLAELGFDVILKVNAGERAIGRALADFEQRLTKAEVGLVFYAGHGIQAGRRNYLIPAVDGTTAEGEPGRRRLSDRDPPWRNPGFRGRQQDSLLRRT